MLSKRKKVLNNPKVNFVTGLMIGLIIMATGVYAATLVNSKNVTYNTANSTLSSTNVQDALDELSEKTNNKMIYFFGDTSSNGSLALKYKSYLTSDFMEIVNGLSSNAFVGININGEKSACIYRNNKVTCIKAGENNFEDNKKILNESNLSGATCNVRSSYVNCNDDSFNCYAYSNGRVYCLDNEHDMDCYVYADGGVKCAA